MPCVEKKFSGNTTVQILFFFIIWILIVGTSRKNQKEFRKSKGSVRYLETENWLKIENGEHPTSVPNIEKFLKFRFSSSSRVGSNDDDFGYMP